MITRLHDYVAEDYKIMVMCACMCVWEEVREKYTYEHKIIWGMINYIKK